MGEWLLILLILAPVAFGLLAWAAPGDRSRGWAVTVGALATIALSLVFAVTAKTGESWISLADLFGGRTEWLAFGLELLIAIVVAVIAVRVRSRLILALALVQIGLAVAEEWFSLRAAPALPGADFRIDTLAIVMVSIVSIIGSIIAIYALGYMKHHQAHAPATAQGSGRFFFVLVGFLGMMNGLVLADNLRWLTIFWEATTLCSFALIGHDGTPESRKNARLALLINSFGGVAMMLGSLLALSGSGVEHLSGITAANRALIPLAFLALAAFTKSAQLPFQSWLLGAMVAPTPVSALLHSATMVKAGVYLILRLAPGFTGSRVMFAIALAGAFSFAAAAALAVGQSNAKKVLAYSTISNLGLIIACAGINTPLAYATAMMLLLFHAIVKALLFLCVGTIEQKIGSRDIEDMGVVMFELPVTTLMALVGMASMLTPPFGMLVCKWMAIESAIASPLILLFLILGSALTLFFWAKWLGRIQTVSYHATLTREKLPLSILSAEYILGGGVVLTAIMGIPLFQILFAPLAVQTYQGIVISAESLSILDSVGGLDICLIMLFIALAAIANMLTGRYFKPERVRLPFLSGENVVTDARTFRFRGLKDEPDEAWTTALYLDTVFTETKITQWTNWLAILVLLTMFALVVGI
ncbi:MAG: proton-conducting transporter membrane subunit [Proteobacteria bacterium]|nr:proton-conducting transporter membrane subunit [Pseudomonadota bacterium]